MSKESKMNVLINKLSDKPFKYGSNDCFTFTAALVKEWHGKDFRPLHQYKNKSEAEAYIKINHGIETLTVGTLGYPVAAFNCEDGDVVSAEVDKGEVGLGFVYGGRALFKGKKGVKRLDLKKCRQGWRIRANT
jgi:hypothetical protein